ncbi:WD-repeat protein [Crocosphaera subtropica ATCC 51142]|uniref:WD-repeat protein n=1 Tax=Crocosphaera subtropica (strain ATCC 51142 / BH68) TaxID=43989 RepID=B1X336_CROS5|nr:WD40 repeat domain-containing protein [Crocosphaera subtropica]ACB54547.1 WD-repeat protein [Crocosphaera subtropica ATCC 51142]
MDQWINLFIKVSKPILTSIVYTGINSWLEVFQEEITEVHKQQAKNTIKSLTLQDGMIHREGKDFTSCHSTLMMAENKALNRNYIEEEKAWPLRLSPEKLLQKVATDGHNLLFFLVTPKTTFPEFSSFDYTPSNCEQRLWQNLRQFIQKNYSFQIPNKGISFMGGLWDHHHFYGETSIQLLFEQLNSISCLVLETEIQGKNIKFNLVYWRKKAKKYHYTNIFTLNYQNLLIELVKTRVQQWQETRNQLLKLGKSREDIERLGGICEKNHRICEELESLDKEGIKIEQLTVNYQFDQQDYESLCQNLSICCCLLGGWVADIHYLIDDNIPPHLPMWLLSLEESCSQFQSKPDLLNITLSLYEDILIVLGHESLHDVPELALKLAESFMHWPDQTWAIEPLIYSFNCWQQQHQDIDSFSQQDRDYLNHLKQCLQNLTEQEKTKEIREFIKNLTTESTNNLVPQSHFNYFQLQRTISTASEKVLSLKIDKRGYQFISQREPNSLKVWHYNPQKSILSLKYDLGRYAGQLSAATLSQNGQFLASSEITEKRSYIKIWKLSTGQIYRTLFGHRQPIQTLAIHLGNRPFIASGSHKIKLWNFLTGESLLTLFGHKQLVSCLAISPDGKILISGSIDKTLRIWDLKTGNLLKTLTGHKNFITTLILSEDGETIVSGSTDKTIKLWDLKSGKLLQTLTGHLGGLQTFCLYDCYLFAGDDTGKIYLWDLKTGNSLSSWNAHQKGIEAIAISEDGQTLVSSCQEGKVQLWSN